MRQTVFEKSYTERLFGPGLYGMHHRRRFAWLRQQLLALGIPKISILELGCYDGRAIDNVPLEIERYVAFDAGWESGIRDGKPFGLEAARSRFQHDGRFSFRTSTDPADLLKLKEKFDVGICLATLEHIEPSEVESYVLAFSNLLRGPLLVAVPIENGLPLLFKTVAARIFNIDRNIEHYSFSEFMHAVAGRLDKIHRNQHKGFDYAELVRCLKKYFRHVRVMGVTLPGLPLQLQLDVGIVARNGPRLEGEG